MTTVPRRSIIPDRRLNIKSVEALSVSGDPQSQQNTASLLHWVTPWFVKTWGCSVCVQRP
uniref:Uncharacterized protein n=1 Tax=Anguilla anguilla TaxID=7936 RepID=A0A0E9RXD0_ANGAN